MTNYQLGDVVLLSDNLDADYDTRVVGYISSIVYTLQEGERVTRYEVKIGGEYVSIADDGTDNRAYDIIREIGTIFQR